MNHDLSKKQNDLITRIQNYGRVIVAFSGGVDSTLLAKAAQLACGKNATACIANSPSLANGELNAAKKIALQIGIKLLILETQEFKNEAYRENQPNRCFHCKNELYTTIESQLPKHSYDTILNGANLDDLNDHRPGMIAAKQHAVQSPLLEAKLTKTDVRNLAKEWNLPVWNKPATPCLASRIAYGIEVTPKRVQRVDTAEQFLKTEFNLRELRVRHKENNHAQIEVPLTDLPRLQKEPAKTKLITHLKTLGFQKVTLDPQGFRTGSLNENLPPKNRSP